MDHTLNQKEVSLDEHKSILV